jgi:arylsulfatase A-like enzyme
MAKSPKTTKPNILVIWGDDIGQSNLSCYTHGLMGYRTPNIDRLAKEGMLFTDSYGEQSCTAGRDVHRSSLARVCSERGSPRSASPPRLSACPTTS